MEKWVTKVVNMMKSEKLYASQGGPIILSQVKKLTQNLCLHNFLHLALKMLYEKK